MLRHADIWRAIDSLARTYGFSPSGLARRAGLDPTAFNKSKRVTREGRPRWPSTESISKILRATGASLEEFVALVVGEPEPMPPRRLPLIAYARAGEAGLFDDAGHPVGGAWTEMVFPDFVDAHAFALEVTGDELEPRYRRGDILVVSPASGIRRRDRVLVKTSAGGILTGELASRGAESVEFLGLDGGAAGREVPAAEIAWMHRIVWASQ